MNQPTLQDTVPAWKEAANSSKADRFPWHLHLGRPLRKYAYHCAEKKWKQSAVRSEVKCILWGKGIPITPHLSRCIKIGVSAGYSEFYSLKKVEKMEEKIENITPVENVPATPEPYEESVSWANLETGDREGATYFKPETGVQYRIIIASAILKKDARYKDRNGDPKLKARLELASVNGKDVKLIWDTGSWTIMNAVKGPAIDGSLSERLWLMKKTEENGKIKYIFESLGKVSPSPSSSDVGVFV